MKLICSALFASLLFSPYGFAQKPGDGGKHPAHAMWPKLKPALGEMAPDFRLLDLDDKEFVLKDQLGKKPIVIEFGSYS